MLRGDLVGKQLSPPILGQPTPPKAFAFPEDIGPTEEGNALDITFVIQLGPRRRCKNVAIFRLVR